jgi:diacylglycerol diphosphate phosphatase / phosphatidate phosphatase
VLYNRASRCAHTAGHTSWSFAALFFLSLYLFRFLCASGRPDHGWAMLAAITPTVLAAWVGATRVTDYYHNPSDVVAGGLLGIVIAFLVFQVYVVSAAGRRPAVPQAAAGEAPLLPPRPQSVSVDVGTMPRYRSPSAVSLEAVQAQ